MQAVVTESLAGLRSRESDEVRVVVNCNGGPTGQQADRTEKFAVARCPFATLSTVQTTFPVFGKHDPLPLALRPPRQRGNDLRIATHARAAVGDVPRKVGTPAEQTGRRGDLDRDDGVRAGVHGERGAVDQARRVVAAEQLPLQRFLQIRGGC